ncbi:hypothetical protein [Streptomyces sp. NPDC001404]|uniref:hypothetical protein n=1 Tax=Streptomyces sp. NPDC001404 TaxID=3364571 RepID=UPI0036AC0FB2
MALALRYAGRTVCGGRGTVTVEQGDERTTYVALPDPVAGAPVRGEAAVARARAVLEGAGVTLLEGRDGTGVLVSGSPVPGEVSVVRLEDGRVPRGWGQAQGDWELAMSGYRMLLEADGWTITDRCEIGWTFYRGDGVSAQERAVEVLAALFPRAEGGRPGWLMGAEGDVTWWTPDPKHAARVMMLPYLADALKRAGLSVTEPETQDVAALGCTVWFAQPPAGARPRYRVDDNGSGRPWVIDTHTGRPMRLAMGQEHAEGLAQGFNRSVVRAEERGGGADGAPAGCCRFAALLADGADGGRTAGHGGSHARVPVGRRRA